MFKSELNINEIKRRISKYQKDRAAGQVVDNDGLFSSIFGDRYSYAAESSLIPKGTDFYRVRSIPDDDHFFPSKTIAKLSDAWEAPAEYIKTPGRLNKVNQSILYCCPWDPNLAIEEARARNNKLFALMHYISIRDIQAANIGNYENSGLSKDESTRVFYKFLEDEFSTVVPEGQESRYKLTQAIAESLFNLPEQDAWRYRSIQSPEKFNVAFLPDKAKSCIKLIGVLICDLSVYEDKYVVRAVLDFDNETGEARLHQIGSERQKELFPDIQMSKSEVINV